MGVSIDSIIPLAFVGYLVVDYSRRAEHATHHKLVQLVNNPWLLSGIPPPKMERAMSKTDPVTCLCCGLAKPYTDYYPGNTVCVICAALPANDAVAKAYQAWSARLAWETDAAAGRKAAKVARKLAQYASEGKRCTACHDYLAPDAYNRCASAPDGLQPICKTCNKLMVACKAAGGINTWYVVRDARRKASIARLAAAATGG